MIIALIVKANFDLMKRFLIQLQVSFVPMIAQIITTSLHGFWCYLFVIKYDLKVKGAGYAMIVTALIQFTSVFLLSLTIPRIRPAFFMPTKESFTDWSEYLAISIPATVMICGSWWAFEFLVLASSYLGVAQLAAMVILQNLSFTMFMVPLGFCEGICSLVGSSIGAGNIPMAKRIAEVTFAIAYSCCLVEILLAYLMRRQLASFFT